MSIVMVGMLDEREEVLKIINQAYDVLSDTQQRRQYDAQIVSQGYTPSTTCLAVTK